MGDWPLKELEERIGHVFKDQDLLVDALTHASTGSKTNYERLEFLGDRVLGLVIARLLFEKFPDEMEGDLAKRLASLVQGSMLARISTKIELSEFILLSDAERASGGAENDNIRADVFEALIGAMYLDAGMKPCEAMIAKLWDRVMHKMIEPPLHPKTALQEWAQGRSLPLPVYEIVAQEGPDHAPVFDVAVHVQGHDKIIARGRTRQEAEKLAAKEFFQQMKSET